MTPFEEIYDLALVVIKDYKLDALYNESYEGFLKYMEGMLLMSISRFEGRCEQSLEYEDNITEEGLPSHIFKSSLTLMEKTILADLMVMTWMERETNDATQVNLMLTGRDKKRNSESTNLKEKSERLDRLREKVQDLMMQYQLQPSNFDKILDY